jgi:transcriptional regulator
VYVQPSFDETRIDVLHAWIRQHPFAALVYRGAGGISAAHLPVQLDADGTSPGKLRAHVARANPLWREAQAAPECLVIFQGPSAYISPSWYASKRTTHKVVPTWNYEVVHAHGRLRVVDDAAWLRALVEELTNRFEAGRPEPWQVGDAPADFVEQMLRAIVGIEIEITGLRGKFKLGQNRAAADRLGAVEGLRREGTHEAADVAAAMAARVTP